MERLEPKFYLDKYLINKEKISSSEFNLHKLSEVCNLISDGTHFTPKYQEDGVKFLSVKDVRRFNIRYDNSKFISVNEAILLDRRCKPQKNDVLLTKIGATFGYAAVVDSTERFQIFVSLALLRPNKELISSDFLCLCLNSNWVYLLFERVIKGAGVPDLHLEDIRKIKIPVPPLEIQFQIVEIFNLAYAEKRQKETEAKELLASIDAYLLEQLGIVLPDKIEEKNVFYVPFSKVQGKRFDPFYHKDEFEILDIAISNGKYGNQKLGIFLSQINYGASVKSEYVADGIPFLRISDLQRNEISITEMKYLPKSMQKEIGNAFVYKDDFLISRSGTIGIVARVSKEFDGFAYGSFMIKFTLFENAPIDKDYLSYFLNCETMERIIRRNKIGAVQENITIPTIRNLQIPLPPVEIQTEIANHIWNIRERAKTLEIEAKEVIEKAKAEVEKMILGE